MNCIITKAFKIVFVFLCIVENYHELLTPYVNISVFVQMYYLTFLETYFDIKYFHNKFIRL